MAYVKNSRNANLVEAEKEVKILLGILGKAKQEIKQYRAEQKKLCTQFSFVWYHLPLLKAELTKATASSTIASIAYSGGKLAEDQLLKSVLRRAASPSRSTSPMVNIVHQADLSVEAEIYSKVYVNRCFW